MSADDFFGLGLLGAAGGGGVAAGAAISVSPDLEVTAVLYAEDMKFWGINAHKVLSWAEQIKQSNYGFIASTTRQPLASILLESRRAKFFFDQAEAGDGAALNLEYTHKMRVELRKLLLHRLNFLIGANVLTTLDGILAYLQSGSKFLIQGLEEFWNGENASTGLIIVRLCRQNNELKIKVFEKLLKEPVTDFFLVLNDTNRSNFLQALRQWLNEIPSLDSGYYNRKISFILEKIKHFKDLSIFMDSYSHVTDILHIGGGVSWHDCAHQVVTWFEYLKKFKYVYLDRATGKELTGVLLKPDRARLFFDGARRGQAAAANPRYTAEMRMQLRELLLGRQFFLVKNKHMTMLEGILEYLSSGSIFLIEGLETFLLEQGHCIRQVIVQQYQKKPSLDLKIKILKTLLEEPAKKIFYVLGGKRRGELIVLLKFWIAELAEQDKVRYEQLLKLHQDQHLLEFLACNLGASKEWVDPRLAGLDIAKKILGLCTANPSLQPTRSTVLALLGHTNTDLWECIAHHLLDWLQNLDSFDDYNLEYDYVVRLTIDPANTLLNPKMTEWFFDKRQQVPNSNGGYTSDMQNRLAESLVRRFTHPALGEPLRLVESVVKFITTGSSYLLEKLDSYLRQNKTSILQVLEQINPGECIDLLRKLLDEGGLYVCILAEHLSSSDQLQLTGYLESLGSNPVFSPFPDVREMLKKTLHVVIQKLARDAAQRRAAAAAEQSPHRVVVCRGEKRSPASGGGSAIPGGVLSSKRGKGDGGGGGAWAGPHRR